MKRPALHGRVRFVRFEPIDDEERSLPDDGDCSGVRDTSLPAARLVTYSHGRRPFRIPGAEAGVAVTDPEKRSALLRLIEPVDGDRRM